MIINQGNLTNLFTGFKASFNEGFRSSTPIWALIASLVSSSTREETYAWLGQFPRLREWIGDRQVKNISQGSYAIKNKKFESTISIKRDEIEDDQYGVYSPLFKEMGYAAGTHPDEMLFGLLAAGFATICYDGQFFFDTDHPVGSGVVSNFGGGSGTPWYLLDTSRALKPLIFQKRRDYALRSMTSLDDPNVFMRDEFVYGVDARGNAGFGFWQQAFGSKATLDKAAFEAARMGMKSLKSDEGRPLGIKPTLLVVPPSLEAAANDIINVDRLANGATNPNYHTVQVEVVPWLA